MDIMNKDIIEVCIRSLKRTFVNDVPTKSDILKEVEYLLNNKEDIQTVIDTYEKECGISVPKFNCNKLENMKPSQDFKDRVFDYKKNTHFRNYCKYIRGSISENVAIDVRDIAEKTIVDCADPKATIAQNKRIGLVMGDVQSGKTMNYLAVLNLAIDLGYKILLVLTGVTENLRRQTQKRVDEGVIGANSSTLSTKPEYVGIGKEEKKSFAIPATTTEYDFSKGTRNKMNTQPSDTNMPIVFVVKKNYSSLKQIIKYFDDKKGKITKKAKSILIIDDEADNASINTNKDNKENPSRINGQIRQILRMFSIASYIGYTATPFANVFIKATDQYGNEMDDLYPKDFIISLTAGESYEGSEEFFTNYDHIEIINENDPYFLPARHKKTDDVIALSSNIKNAICYFYLASAVYSLRGYKNSHRSMIINASRFICVHEKIERLVKDYINKLSNILEIFSNKTTEELMNYPQFARIKKMYEKTLGNCGFTFDEIRKQLVEEAKKMKVFNVKNKDEYQPLLNENDGERFIFIGGFLLSRGMTFDGLIVSYYNRNSKNYDTLTQMCRWFGYHNGYSDLTKVYLTQSNYDNFAQINEVLISFRDQLALMEQNNKKPDEFRIKVMESPETLETKLRCTSRNKKRTGIESYLSIDLSSQFVDTSKIFADKTINDINFNAIKSMLKSIKQANLEKEQTDRIFYRGIKSNIILNLLKKIKVPAKNRQFQNDAMIKFFEKNDLKLCDVVFATGNRKSKLTYSFDDTITYASPERSFCFDEEENLIAIAKQNNRLIDPGIFKTGLDEEGIQRAKDSAEKRIRLKRGSAMKKATTPIATDYLKERKNPILVIYPIALKDDALCNKEKESYKRKDGNVDYLKNNLYGFAIGFPQTKNGETVKYSYNSTIVVDEDEDEDEDV